MGPINMCQLITQAVDRLVSIGPDQPIYLDFVTGLLPALAHRCIRGIFPVLDTAPRQIPENEDLAPEQEYFPAVFGKHNCHRTLAGDF